MIQRAVWGIAVLAAFSLSANAAEVNVKGVHLCCGGCVNDAKGSLTDVKGVTDVNADANTKVVVFKAADETAAAEGLKALAAAGFHGTVTIDKKPAAFPSANVEKGTKANSIKVTGVHLCCGACVTGVKKALEEVPNVTEMKIDREAKSVSVSGKDVDVNAFLDALYKGGYHGELEKKK